MVGVNEAFFIDAGAGRYVATEYTRGPWDAASQHGGPPAALLGTTTVAHESIDGQRVARLTFEILRPVPIGPVRIQARVVRPGRRVSLVEGVLTDDAGQELMLVRGWRVAGTPDDAPATSMTPPSAGPEAGTIGPWFSESSRPAFEHGVEVRFLEGGFTTLGPGRAWFRLAIPLIEGVPIEPLARVLVAADCGNGISGELDFSRYVYINPDLSVRLSRLPEGEWVLLEARTTIEPGGVGMAIGDLSDERGPLGRSDQSLFIAAR